MKKITITLIFAALTIVCSCKDGSKSNNSEGQDSTEMTDSNTEKTSDSESSNPNNTNSKENERTYIVRSDSTTVRWTAYKTSDRVAVGGEFTKIEFSRSHGGTIAEAFNNIEFTIPTASIFTKNEERDQKLLASFFNVMLDTKNITGKILFNEKGHCTAAITMNGVTKNVPLKYFAGKNEVDFTAEINLEDWDATGALKILNAACGDLHKGKDGISKTWADVAIHIKTKY